MFINLTMAVREVLDRAHSEAQRGGGAAIATEHLFLALLHEDTTSLALLNAGVDVLALEEYLRELARSDGLPSEARDLGLDRRVHLVLRLADREAIARGQPNIGLLDLLMGLLSEPRGVATQALRASGSGVEPVRQHIAELLRGRPLRTPAPAPFIPREAEHLTAFLDDGAQAVLARASEEAARQGYASVQPHHILVALLSVEEGIAWVALRAVDLDPADVREEAERWIAPDDPGVPIGPSRVGATALRFLHRTAIRPGLAGAERASRVDMLCEMLDGSDVCLPTILERFHVPATELAHELADLAGSDVQTVLEDATATLSAARASGRHEEELDRALTRAREEAHRLGADHVGTEHLLAALAQDSHCAAIRALDALGVSAARLAEANALSLGGCTDANLPLTPHAERAIHLARLEARHLAHERVGTGHLLLALYWQRKGTASRVLRDLGVVPSRLRKEVLAATTTPDGTERAIYPPMTSRARAVLAQAARLVTGPSWPAVGPGQLLTALEEQKGGVLDHVFRRLAVSPVPLRVWAKAACEDAAPPPRPRPFHESVARALTTAWEEAEQMGLEHVGTAHLFLGLLRCAARGMRGADAFTVQGVRSTTRDVLTPSK